MDRKIIGVFIVAVFAVAIVIGGVHSALSVIEASAASKNPAEGEYVARLATDNDQGSSPGGVAIRLSFPLTYHPLNPNINHRK